MREKCDKKWNLQNSPRIGTNKVEMFVFLDKTCLVLELYNVDFTCRIKSGGTQSDYGTSVLSASLEVVAPLGPAHYWPPSHGTDQSSLWTHPPSAVCQDTSHHNIMDPHSPVCQDTVKDNIMTPNS